MAIGRKKTERVASEPPGGPVKGVGGKGGADADAAPPAKKSKKMKIILLVVILAVVGAAAKFTVLAPASAADAKPVPGVVLPMEDMTLNLANGHFLRLKMALQTVKGTSDELDTSKAQQLIIDQFSNVSVAALTGKPARDKAQKGLVAKIQKAYPKEIITAYYTEFVMQ